MLEGESGSAVTLSFDDQSRDLDNLTFTSSGGAGVALSVGQLLERCRGLAAVGCHYGEKGVLDRVHVGSLRRGAEERLIPH